MFACTPRSSLKFPFDSVICANSQAQIDLTLQRGQVSQSFQVAPFDNGYWPVDNSSKNWISYDAEDVVVNSYRGGVYQQALSHLAYVDDDVFVDGGGQFGIYGE